MARFATEKYKPAKDSSKKKTNYMHLTNYAINKKNKNYNKGGEEDDEDAHKRSVISILEVLKNEQGGDVEKIWNGIREITVKTLLGVQPELSHIYKAWQPSDKLGGMWFELLGFDIILDKHLRPWLLEVNSLPSFNTESKFDRKIKDALIKDTFAILNVSQKDRKTVKIMEKLEYDKRGIQSAEKQAKSDQDRHSFYTKYNEQKNKHEEENLGNYEMVFPWKNPERMEAYKAVLSKAKSMWIESTSGPTTKKPSKSKSTTKSSVKKEKLNKKTIVSPFKKIYSTSEPTKIKFKSPGNIGSTTKDIKIDSEVAIEFHIPQEPQKKATSFTPINNSASNNSILMPNVQNRNQNFKGNIFSDNNSFCDNSPRKFFDNDINDEKFSTIDRKGKETIIEYKTLIFHVIILLKVPNIIKC